MICGSIPDPHLKARAEINRKTAEFFAAGGQMTKASDFKPQHPPIRSAAIDPETVLKRRRSSPARSVCKEPQKLGIEG